MGQNSRADEQASTTEPKFYLPAGAPPPIVASRLEWVWSTLFTHGIETSG